MGVPSAQILSISGSGEMALLLDPQYTVGWMRSGTLARAPLSGGVPRPMMQDVHDADWSPDGQSLAVVRAVSGRYNLEYPAGKVLYETSAWVHAPRVSRDGKLVAFLDHPSPGDDRGTVAVVDASGKVRTLTETFSSTGSLAWSKDNDEIWFSAGRTGNVRSVYAVDLQGRLRMVDGAPADIVLADISAAGKVLVTMNTGRRGIIGTAPGDETERDLSWLDWSRPGALSADGRWVLFEEQGQGGGPGYSVYLRGTDGSPAVRLGEGSAGDLSPDGKWAATASLTKPDQIVLLPRGAGDARTLPLPGFAVTAVYWTPDGRRLLFVGSEKGDLRRLYAMDVEGGKPRPITPGGVGFATSVSPDSRRVAVTMTYQTPEIYPIDGGEPRPVPGALPGDQPCLWSADGRTLFVWVRTPPDARVDRIDLATGERTTWKTLRPADRAGVLDIGFVQLSGDARSYVYSYRRILSTLYLVEGLR
jgi:Tol biopolymer transport system component